MNKIIYEKTIETLRSSREMEDMLNGIGFSFDYESGRIGNHFLTVLHNCEEMIKESLGIHSIEEKTTCYINGIDYPITVDILYTDDNDADFAITENDFCEFANIVAYDDEIGNALKDAMWKAITEKDNDAKKKVNQLMKDGTLGGVDKYIKK